ncbi:MAG TPA: hypothetical protein PK857_01900 [Hyphomicrobium sp.]|nr:hypothetical protein [Hyphomicrobium sp.]
MTIPMEYRTATIRDVAVALWKNVDAAAPERMLESLPEAAREFWRP